MKNEPREVVLSDNSKTVGYACSECGTFYANLRIGDETSYQFAEKCCEEKYCQSCGCSLGKHTYILKCRDCLDISYYDKGKETSIDYLNWIVYSIDHDKYYDRTDMDLMWDDGVKWVFDTTFEPVKIDPERVFEEIDERYNTSDDSYSMSEMIDGAEELEKAIEEFNSKNEKVGLYYPDYKFYAKVPEEDIENG